MLLFHHDPLHSDDFLDDLYRDVRQRWSAVGGDPDDVQMAVERAEIDLGARSTSAPVAEAK